MLYRAEQEVRVLPRPAFGPGCNSNYPGPHPCAYALSSSSRKSPLHKFVVEMAGRQAFRDNPELQQFVLPEARPTGRQLGVGSYGSVEELQVKGLVCAGKRMHEALLQRDNEGVINIERKYLEECQVMPITTAAKVQCIVGGGYNRCTRLTL